MKHLGYVLLQSITSLRVAFRSGFLSENHCWNVRSHPRNGFACLCDPVITMSMYVNVIVFALQVQRSPNMNSHGGRALLDVKLAEDIFFPHMSCD